jgi:hypothetical protein
VGPVDCVMEEVWRGVREVRRSIVSRQRSDFVGNADWGRPVLCAGDREGRPHLEGL